MVLEIYHVFMELNILLFVIACALMVHSMKFTSCHILPQTQYSFLSETHIANRKGLMYVSFCAQS